jgi:sugar/nucleoside kinase (ribokinase family)
MTASPDLVLVGNLLVDDIVLAGGRTLLGEPGGAVLHAALAASLWNCRVGIVSVVGTDYPETTLVTLAGRGVDLARSFGDRSDRPFLSLDPFELLQDENARRWREPLAMIDGFFAGEDDLRISGDAKAIVRELAGARLRLLALKQSDRGGLLVDLHAGETHGWPAHAAGVVDVTGAGEAFAGGFLAAWLTGGDIPRGIAQGVVAASFAIEDWGSRGLARATPDAARQRLSTWFPEVAIANLGQTTR